MQRRRVKAALVLATLLGVGWWLWSSSGTPDALPGADAPAASAPGDRADPRSARTTPTRLGARAQVEPTAHPNDIADTGIGEAAVQVDLEITWPDGSTVDRTVLVVGQGCPVWARVVDGRGAVTIARHWQSCALQARLSDGLLWRRTEWVDVDLGGGDDQQATLVLPSERTGGLGVAIAAHDEGIEVTAVYPGTPAWDLGLERGDVIVEVDGLPASTLELDEFIEVATGPEGSEVDLVVAYDGDTGTVEEELSVARSFLSHALVGVHRWALPPGHPPLRRDQ